MGNYLEDLMIREEYHLAHPTMVQDDANNLQMFWIKILSLHF